MTTGEVRLLAFLLLALVAVFISRYVHAVRRLPTMRTPDEHATHYDSIGTFHAESLDQQDKA
ncbi:hypothetical protein [Pararobbsia alpina]|uniref:hypothetical protein n=1 Tax=Pararobbsia alpina TaxID=621374 RepID=UPI0039A4B14E